MAMLSAYRSATKLKPSFLYNGTYSALNNPPTRALHIDPIVDHLEALIQQQNTLRL